MFAYPAGGDLGASTLTTGLVAGGDRGLCASRLEADPRAACSTPFALGLVAASLGRYPYGGSARTMQYVAPAIILMAGLGCRRPALAAASAAMAGTVASPGDGLAAR